MTLCPLQGWETCRLNSRTNDRGVTSENLQQVVLALHRTPFIMREPIVRIQTIGLSIASNASQFRAFVMKPRYHPCDPERSEWAPVQFSWYSNKKKNDRGTVGMAISIINFCPPRREGR
jgi:hypothetical protein